MPKTVTLPPFPKPVFGVYNQWGREPGNTPPFRSDIERFRIGYRSPGFIGPTHSSREALLELLVDGWRRQCRDIRRSALTLEDVLVGRTFTGMNQTRYGTVTFVTDLGDITLSPTRGWLYGTVTGPDDAFTVERVLKTHRTLRLVGGDRIDFPKKMGIFSVAEGVIDDIYGPLIENSD